MSYLDNVKNKRTEKAEATHKQASLDAFTSLSSEIRTLLSSLEKTGAKTLDKDFIKAVAALKTVANSLQSIRVTSDEDIKTSLRTLTKAVAAIDTRPVVKVASPTVEVNEREIDFKPLINELKKLEKKAPEVSIDISGLTESINEVKKAISDLIFPVANYVSPFKDASKSTQALVDSEGHVQADILSMPAVTIDTTGLATSANQTSGDQKVQIVDSGGEAATVTSGKLDVNASIDTTGLATTLTDTNTSAIKTAVEILDNAISGSEMQVDVVAALPAGTNNIGDVDVLSLPAIPAGTNNIGDVDIASIAAGDNNIGNVDVVTLPALPAGNNNIGDVDVASLPVAFNTGTRSATTQRVTIATDDLVPVSGTVSITANSAVNVAQMNGVAVTMGSGNVGTGVQRVTIAADSTGQIIARGPVAQDVAVSGNPLLNGGRASAAEPTAMSNDGDAVHMWTDLRGRQVMTQKAGTATLSNVSASASSVTVLAANTSRLGAVIVNDSTAICYLKFGSTASSTSYTYKMQADDVVEVPFGYTGIITGLWASATGNARVTEIT